MSPKCPSVPRITGFGQEGPPISVHIRHTRGMSYVACSPSHSFVRQLASCSWGQGGLEPDGSLLRAGLSGSCGQAIRVCGRTSVLFAATGTAKPVPKQEPCRLELNEALRTFKRTTHMVYITLSCIVRLWRYRPTGILEFPIYTRQRERLRVCFA
eukprot:COSAG02_NODE_4156_length_5698_cov_5911.583318_3_plen_155_part_00